MNRFNRHHRTQAKEAQYLTNAIGAAVARRGKSAGISWIRLRPITTVLLFNRAEWVLSLKPDWQLWRKIRRLTYALVNSF